MRKVFALTTVMLLLLTAGAPANAQGPAVNKVIIKDRKWQVAETPHFKAYYYDLNEATLQRVVAALENGYRKITSDLNIEPSEKIPFFLYKSHNDFEQNNISPAGEGTGGFTEPLKNRFVLPLDRSEKQFTHVIEHEMTHALTFELFFGGHFWRSIYLVKSYFYPLWFMEGLAEYESSPYDISDEMLLRDAVINNGLLPLHELLSFDHLQSNQVVLAYKEGQSALRYIATKYGPNKVVDILYLMKDSYDVSQVLTSTVKKDIFNFNKEWQLYLRDKYGQQVAGKKKLSAYGQRLTSLGYTNSHGQLSPDGSRMVFISDRHKYYEFYTAAPDGSHQQPLLDWWNRLKFDSVNLDSNVFSYSADSRYLVFAAKRQERDYLYIYDLAKHKLRRLDVGFEDVFSPAFSPDGRQIVFTGYANGQSDLYLVDRDGHDLKELTNDQYDDEYPVFMPDGQHLIYVSERDGLRHLYGLDMASGGQYRITKDEQEETAPQVIENGARLLYIGTYEGIYNVYEYTFNGGNVVKLTDVDTGVLTASIVKDRNLILLSGYNRGTTDLYLGPYDPAATAAIREETSYPVIVSTTTAAHLPSPITPAAKLILNKYPYRLKVSTDYIFPLFVVYAGTDGAGVAGAAYWQASDMTGNHVLSAGSTYTSDNNMLDYSLNYSYSRWRPQFSASISGGTGYGLNSDGNLLRVRHYQETVAASYPLDRNNNLVLGLANVDEYSRNRDQNDSSVHDRANVTFAQFSRDYTSGELFDINYGQRFNLSAELGRNLFDGNVRYDTLSMEWQAYWTSTENLIWATRLLTLDSSGRDFQTFTLGNRDNLRGFSNEESLNGRILALGNIESRFYIFRNIDYDVWFMMPDIYFKSLQAVFFTDNGLIGKDWPGFRDQSESLGNLRNSIGAGLRMNSLILQQFPLILRLDYAKRTDERSDGIWYFNLGASF